MGGVAKVVWRAGWLWEVARTEAFDTIHYAHFAAILPEKVSVPCPVGHQDGPWYWNPNRRIGAVSCESRTA
jgi:hypothetical protein